MSSLQKSNGAINSNNSDENLFRLLLAHVENYAVIMVDANGYIMSWNKGTQQLTGYAEKEIIGKHIDIFYKPEDTQKGEPLINLNNALKKGTHEIESWQVKKDGSEFWANIVFTTIYDDDGRLKGFANVIRDLTTDKDREREQDKQNTQLEKKVNAETKKILVRELRFRRLVENSYDGITLFNHNYDIIYRSPSSERIDGWSEKEIACKVLDDLLFPDDKAVIKKVFDAIKLKPSVPVKTKLRTLHKKGHYFWVECVFINWLEDEYINAIVCNFRDITDSVNANQEIVSQNKRIEDILGSITEGFIALDKNFCYTYVNREIGEMLGRDPESLIGKNIWEEYPAAIGSLTFKAFHQALAQQQYVTNQDYLAQLDLWYENHIYPSANGLSVFIRDITLQKRHQELQEKNNALLKEAAATQAAILNALPPNIALLNEKGKIMAVNESWKKFTLATNLGLPDYGIGYNYLAFCGKAMGINTSDTNKVVKGIKDVINRQKYSFEFEYIINLADQERCYQLVVAPLAGHNDKGAVVLHNDITDRKKAEALVLKSEANLRSVFENTDLAIVLFDKDLKILSFNTNAQNLTIKNYGKKLKRGNSAFNYFPKERKTSIKDITENISSNKIFGYETTFQLKDGTHEWYEVNWKGIVNENGGNIGYIFTLKDITEKKLTDIERENITTNLVTRNADLEHFAYIISHNLRAPVANIIGLAGLLGKMDIKDAEDAEILKALALSINKLDLTVHNLNDILQINSLK